MTVIDDIITKCEEIDVQVAFIRTLAGKATDPKWVENDVGYVHVTAVYTNAKAQLVTLIGELP
jgi:hypothetical protein